MDQITGGEPNLIDRTGLCLLSLDGGGVRGLSSLYVLKAIMSRLNSVRRVAGLPVVKPCEIFDLIGGTSTGALIAIMLGRLEMNVDDCISAYTEIMPTIFDKKLHSTQVGLSGRVQPRFDSKKLKTSIDALITKSGCSLQEPFNDGRERGCKVFVCAATKELYGIIHLRSYGLPEKLDIIPATICEAALATSAATGFFDPVLIGGRLFVDGALGANNPVDEVEREASDIWCSETGDLKPLVKCFISIGTGNPGKTAIEDNLPRFLSKTLVKITTETEETAGKFIERWRQHYDLKRYFRFNVEQGLQDVGLDEHREQGKIETATQSYLERQELSFQLRDCVKNLKQKQSIAGTDLEARFRNQPSFKNIKSSKLLRRLLTSPYEDRKDRNPERLIGTCEWFISHERFRIWREQMSSALLWVSADPGCGKSVLARHLVDTVLPSVNTRTTCYFFFKDDFEDQKSLTSALCCILHQLFRQQPALLSDQILDEFEEGGEKLFTSFRSLWRILTSVTNRNDVGEIICVLDALDECEEEGQVQLTGALNEFYSSTRSTTSILKFLVTSRPYAQIQQELQTLEDQQPTIHLSGENQAEVEKISHEIDIVIGARLQELKARLKLLDEEIRVLRDELTTVHNRTYLWVYLVFDVMKKEVAFTKGDLRASIRNLPKTVEAAYDKILRRSLHSSRARKVLHIVVAAERPLSLPEMAVALAITENHRSYSELEGNLLLPDRLHHTVREACGLFVVIKDSRVYLLHQTAKEFLVRRSSSEIARTSQDSLEWQHSLCPLESNRIVSEICIWYLLFTNFQEPLWGCGSGSGKPVQNSGFEKVDESSPYTFLNYAAENWATHFRQARTRSGTKSASSVLQLCNPDLQTCSTWFGIYWRTTAFKWTTGFTTLMIASYFGLEIVVDLLLEAKKGNLNSRDTTYKRSALSWACRNGHGSVVKLLLDRIPKYKVVLRDWWSKTSTIVNSEDVHYRTPLSYAAENGHEGIVKMLLEKGAKVDLSDNFDQTPLLLASGNGHEATVKLLLDRGADIEGRNSYGHTPLYSAVSKGQETTEKLLLGTGTNIEGRNSYGDIPLYSAASNGFEATIKLLLDKGADIDGQDHYGNTPLSRAASNRLEAIVKLFIDKGTSV